MKKNKTDMIRILVVDDEEAVLESYQKIFRSFRDILPSEVEAKQLEEKLFGKKDEKPSRVSIDLVPCRQARMAVETVRSACEDKKPFAVAFIDVRLPPGPDGVWAAEQIRAVDPDLEVVMVTAYSDVDPSEIARRVPPEDKLLYLQKPFHPQEIRQFATALYAKWRAEKLLQNANRELEQRVQERTFALIETNEQLKEEIAQRKKSEEALRKREAELERNARELGDANTALKVLLRKRDDHKIEIEQRVLSNLKDLILPNLKALKASGLNKSQSDQVNILTTNLKDLVSPFSQKLSAQYLDLTPKEIQVANFVKEGKTTKEIARMLHVTPNAVVFKRPNTSVMKRCLA